VTPRAALLGTLAGVSVTFISMRPAAQMFMTPMIGFVCFSIILASWFGGVKYRGVPAGLVAIAVGSVIAWVSAAAGWGFGGLSLDGLTKSVANFGFSLPIPAINHTFHGFKYLGVILVTAIPFGIYDLVEALDNVESAAVAGDSFPTTRVLTADGVVSLIGCLMGNPFINAVYIGHPGWKSMGGRIGYSAATGVMVIVLSWLGVISVMVSLVPVVAISPILLYIGMLIGAQSFQETPKSHAPAIILALTPHLAAWGKLQIDGALHAAGTSVAAVGFDKLGQRGDPVPGPRGDGRRVHPGRSDPGRDRRVRHRPKLHQGVDLLAGGSGADLPRLHARREDRLRRIADHGAGVSRRGHRPLCVRALGRSRAGARAGGRGHGEPSRCRRRSDGPLLYVSSIPSRTTNAATASTPSPWRTQVKTKGRWPRILRASRSITSSDAPTCGARSVLLITSRSDRVIPGPPFRGILSPPATSMT
jgi:hypothetical protein